MTRLQNTKYRGPTSVRVPPTTRKFLIEREMSLAGLMRVAPMWCSQYTEAMSWQKVLTEQRDQAESQMRKLLEENRELRKYKDMYVATLKVKK